MMFLGKCGLIQHFPKLFLFLFAEIYTEKSARIRICETVIIGKVRNNVFLKKVLLKGNEKECIPK